MPPRLRSSSVPPSPSILGPPPPSAVAALPSSSIPKTASHRRCPSDPHPSIQKVQPTPMGQAGKVQVTTSLGSASSQSGPLASNNPSLPPSGSIEPDHSLPPAEAEASGQRVNPQVVPIQRPQQGKTWSKVLFPERRHLQCIGTPGTHVSGMPLITILEESVSQTIDEWKEFLIGQFYGLPPPMGRVIGVANGLWSKGSCRIRVQDIGNGTLLFKVPNEAIRMHILTRKFWHIGQCPMFVSSWNPHHSHDKPPLTSISTWVSFRNLPHSLYNSDNITRIATGVGRPLYLDQATAAKDNVSVARVYIDVQLRYPLPDRVYVTAPDGKELRVDVAYDWIPPLCNICREIGHNVKHCPNQHHAAMNTLKVKPVEPAAPSIPVEEEAPEQPPPDVSTQKTELQNTAEQNQHDATKEQRPGHESEEALAQTQILPTRDKVVVVSTPVSKTQEVMSVGIQAESSKLTAEGRVEIFPNKKSGLGKQKLKSRGRKATRVN